MHDLAAYFASQRWKASCRCVGDVSPAAVLTKLIGKVSYTLLALPNWYLCIFCEPAQFDVARSRVAVADHIAIHSV
jgi:hypothetical protein